MDDIRSIIVRDSLLHKNAFLFANMREHTKFKLSKKFIELNEFDKFKMINAKGKDVLFMYAIMLCRIEIVEYLIPERSQDILIMGIRVVTDIEIYKKIKPLIHSKDDMINHEVFETAIREKKYKMIRSLFSICHKDLNPELFILDIMKSNDLKLIKWASKIYDYNRCEHIRRVIQFSMDAPEKVFNFLFTKLNRTNILKLIDHHLDACCRNTHGFVAMLGLMDKTDIERKRKILNILKSDGVSLGDYKKIISHPSIQKMILELEN
jgi:hypothetical protein